jgi:endonuclease III-like uncharacterized protein
MSNMSYCRFHNTNLDLQDCIDAIEEMNYENIEDVEISRMEEEALEEMIEKGRYYAQIAEELMEKIEEHKHEKKCRTEEEVVQILRR